ncbi:MAG: flagellar protein FlaG [Clostridiales bacterium]|nr:flagellar protein FlaG [Clostridiales bacterium]
MDVDSLKTMVSVSTGDAAYKTAVNAQPGKTEMAPGGQEKVQADVKLKIVGDKDNSNKESTVSEGLRGDEEKISNEFFDKIIKEANDKIFITNREFNYSVHEATNRIAIKVLDKTTKEVIREIPPEKTLDAVAKMLELVGVIIDEKI